MHDDCLRRAHQYGLLTFGECFDQAEDEVAVLARRGDDLTASGAAATIAGSCRAVRAGHREIAKGITAGFVTLTPALNLLTSGITGRIVHDDHLKVCGRDVLPGERMQAVFQEVRAFEGGNYYGNTVRHVCSRHSYIFSSKNGPMTSASSGDVQKHSIASRGEHTIGSPRVLNEVLTSTGTPVRF